MSSKHDIAVSVRGLSKSYTIAHNAPKHTTMAEALRHSFKKPVQRVTSETFWALKDVDFDIQKGDVVGIIGRNGAGKSTLLKILSRITEPTTGQIDLYGRVGSLLEVGTGFHPELTGRENIYMNGAILGMTRREITKHFDEIVAFAEVEKFLDTPVKRYSSGMYVRLAFAVAAHLNPEILIVDEVLAVGDAEFQRKCLGKMHDVSEQEGRTVIFVSHNMNAIQSLCSRCLTMQRGKLVFSGPTDEAISQHRKMPAIGIEATPGQYDLSYRENILTPGSIILRKVTFKDDKGNITNTVALGESLSIIIDVEGLDEYRNTLVGVRIKSDNDLLLFGFNTEMKRPLIQPDRQRCEQYILHIPSVPFMPGTYWIDVGADKVATCQLDYVERAACLYIVENDVYGSGHHVTSRDGIMYINGEWEVRTQADFAEMLCG